MVDHQFLKETSRFYKPLLRLETWLDRSMQQILTSSSHAEQLLIERFRCDPNRVTKLPDSVNADVFRPADTYSSDELVELRRSLEIPADRRLIVYLGLLAEHQGTSHLLQALQRIVQTRQDVHLLLMGFPSVDVYLTKAYELGIASFVTMTGRIPYQQAPKYLALGDVAAAPKLSSTEGAGKLLNYMAVGLPTVAFDTPVAREYLGLDGFLARAGDVDSLAENLLRSLFPEESNVNVAGMGRQLRQRAMQLFSWEMTGRQIVSVYEQLISGQVAAVAPTTTKQRQSVSPQT
jgi:glycosyltransferase involved in cell wall biosynthesis